MKKDEVKFVAPILADLAAAFARRGKAIRYHGTPTLDRMFDGHGESLRFDLKGVAKLSLCLILWETGDWWFLACQRKPGRAGGWLFKHELRGDMIGLTAELVVGAVEQSMLAAQQPSENRAAWLRDVWMAPRRRPDPQPKVATGRRVIRVEPAAAQSVRVAFADGSAGIADLCDLVFGRGGMFAPLAAPVYFARVTVDADAGTIVWPNGLDLDPDVLYHRATGRPLPGYPVLGAVAST